MHGNHWYTYEGHKLSNWFNQEHLKKYFKVYRFNNSVEILQMWNQNIIKNIGPVYFTENIYVYKKKQERDVTT